MNTKRRSETGPYGQRKNANVSSGIALGGVLSGFAALAGMQLGTTYGSFLPLAATAIGGMAGGAFTSAMRRNMDKIAGLRLAHIEASSKQEEDVADQRLSPSTPTGPAVEGASAKPKQAATNLGSIPSTPEFPVEVSELRIKLDLARLYVQLGDPELAIKLLKEVLDLEIAIEKGLTAEILRESDQVPPETEGA